MSQPLAFEALTVRLGAREALSGVEATVGEGVFAAVCGPNGAGKSTLLRAAMGLIRPWGGAARLWGDAAYGMNPAVRATQAAYLPQDRQIAWGLPALDIAALGALQLPAREAEVRARLALAQVGMEAFAERRVDQMSGGERARVLLARLLAASAPLMLLDEPVAGLDPAAQLLTMSILRRAVDDGATVVVSLHDLDLCARFADLVLLLDEGRLVACAPPLEALCPEVLAEVFDLDAEWLATPRGHRLDARAR